MKKSTEKPPATACYTDVATAELQHDRSPRAWLFKIASLGVEMRGIAPVPLQERSDKRYINVFFVWLTMSTNLLPIVTGMVGTLSYGLSLRDSSLVILFFGLFCTIPPAYLSTFGAKTGLRQMLQARFTFGYYLVSIIVMLNLCTIAGFGIIDCVLGGLTLAAVSDGNINATTGIVIIALCGMIISFGGYQFLHQFERYSWIFALVAIVIATGIGGHHLSTNAVTEPPAAATIVSFGGVIAGFLIPWAAMASDFAVYCDPSVSGIRIFSYIYAGLLVPSVPLMVLGAAIGAAVPNIPSWSAGNTDYSAGGVLEAMLHPVGGFGKFVSVLLAFSLLGNLAAAMYSISLNFQLVIPIMARVPRLLFTIIYTAVAIPVSIYAANSFFDSLENFLYVIAYWSAAFVGVVMTEHFVFRNADCNQYNPGDCDNSSKFPTGIVAIAAIRLSSGSIVPCMSQIWYTGPPAEKTGYWN
ncbi:uncharacterized protein N7443_001612 [Penicillium atrosanguineum]|uniref:Uncharacterized protein n=1 Tax=Penicillium atrosanguineum TaxID=1132637 RepID=A0A9W9QGF7_9EURO|nr:uncharacterized protein N7443_001612 [Penicillium atrosanguineum]KAJ5314728.1 hypothetical protein N7443_001612 [Penicillium atrosanguineum]KAJ5331898.1 hypothetical protein N7476_001681 [Penicillium atrosanguineum]